MSPQCSNGTGVAAGAPAFFTYTEADVAQFAPPLFGFVALALMGLPTLPVFTADFCAIEPSGDLPVSPDDYALLAFPPLALAAGTYRRFGNQIALNRFQEVCTCLGAVAPSNTSPCTFLATGTVALGASSNVAACPLGATCRYPTVAAWTIPAGQHHMRLNITNVVQGGGSNHIGLYSSPSGTYFQATVTGSANTSVEGDFPTTDTTVFFWYHGTVSFSGFDYTLNTWNRASESPCSGSSYPITPPPPLDPPPDWPDPPVAPTCGSYQDICDTLPLILAKLLSIDQLVTLIQRQEVPFSYVPGPTFTGLVDSGEISVQGLLGCLVDITAGSGSVGMETGTPDQTFEAGWIAWGNADGFAQREFISNETLLSLPSAAGQYTRIGYTLTEGVTVSITELVREP